MSLQSHIQIQQWQDVHIIKWQKVIAVDIMMNKHGDYGQEEEEYDEETEEEFCNVNNTDLWTV